MLSNKDNLFKAVFEESSLGMLLVDRSGKIRKANKQSTQSFKQKLADLEEKKLD